MSIEPHVYALLKTLTFKMGGIIDSTRVCIGYPTDVALRSLYNHWLKLDQIDPLTEDMEKELRERVHVVLDTLTFAKAGVLDGNHRLLPENTAEALHALREYLGFVTVTGTLYGSSYSGCGGWSSWKIRTISFCCPQEQVARMKEVHEETTRNTGGTFTRTHIEWD